jgi:predicted metal-dependent hydrolase
MMPRKLMAKKFIHFNGIPLTLDIRPDQPLQGYRLTMQPDGQLKLTLPRYLTDKDIQSLLSRHRRWIKNRLQEQEVKARIGDPFFFRDGASMPVLGGSARLSVQVNAHQTSTWHFHDQTLRVTVPKPDPDSIYPLVQHWYRVLTRSFLEDRIPIWTVRIQVNVNRIFVKDQRSLWASCSRRKNLNFNWRTALLPPSTAEYLIIHELCHLRELNHSRKFWSMLKEHCPDYQKENAYLKKANHWLKFP